MKKQIIYFIAIVFVAFQALSACSMAASSSTAVKNAAKKYKMGNYTGCLQDCQDIVAKDPSNALAYYYIAISYVQAGKKDKAVEAYSKVLGLKPTAILADYATTGKRCIETPDQCVAKDGTDTSDPDLDKLINSSSADGLSSKVRQDLEQKQLEIIKNNINNGQEVDDYNLKKINDASGQAIPSDTNLVAEKKPTNDEVVAAIKVLQNAGVNPYETTAAYQNPDAIQADMLSSFNNPSGNGEKDAVLNMIPLMMAQSKTGQGNYSPQLMQAFIMNSMMGSMNLDVNKNENENY